MDRRCRGCVGIILLGLVLSDRGWAGQSSGDSLDLVFRYLKSYWGIARYSAEFGRLFTGARPKVNFLQPAAMLGLLASLCPKKKVNCIPHPESVLGKTVPDGRIFVVHGAVHPMYEALCIVHELEHQNDGPNRSPTVNEVPSRSIEKDYLRTVLGKRWYDETATELRARCLPMTIGSYVYRDPTSGAIEHLERQFAKLGIVLEPSRHHAGLLRNSVMFLANDQETLTHPFFVASFRPAPWVLSARSPIGRRLDAVQLGVVAALRYEIVVRSDLDDTGAVEHDDQIGHPHRGETM